jgi:hypothetical protein
MRFSVKRSRKSARKYKKRSGRGGRMCKSKFVFYPKTQRCVKLGGRIDKREGLSKFRSHVKALGHHSY